jgi:hypothetical protein
VFEEARIINHMIRAADLFILGELGGETAGDLLGSGAVARSQALLANLFGHGHNASRVAVGLKLVFEEERNVQNHQRQVAVRFEEGEFPLAHSRMDDPLHALAGFGGGENDPGQSRPVEMAIGLENGAAEGFAQFRLARWPGSTTSRAMASASITNAPCSRSIAATVLFPLP